VVYGEAGSTYSWHSALGRTSLRIEVAPTQVIVAGNVLYFVTGTTQTLYKVVLN
jgi:hypothetical protein